MVSFISFICIDLGNSYYCVGVWQNDSVEIVSNDHNNHTFFSYVSFTDSERLIGDAAKNQTAMNPTNTFYDANHLIGRRFNDIDFKNETKDFTTVNISSMVLTKMKDTAKAYIDEKVSNDETTKKKYETGRVGAATRGFPGGDASNASNNNGSTVENID
ncbi:hypothetical protein PIROE2DRAFT_6580 [Piromyces sp. E2]|nr:hypothetical protein PIROE2DRAFT_6580 [Piromyces sp. E2]|eukprot:OUM66242.1 hypothetical protein PIROE2DRAFT_6580 [Piromyces sp. E2]